MQWGIGVIEHYLPGRVPRPMQWVASLFVALAVAISPISTEILGGIGGVSAAIELIDIVALIAVCVALQKGSVYFDGRVLWFIVALLALSTMAEFVHQLQPIPPVPVFFSGFRRGGTLLVLVLIMVSAAMARATLSDDAVFTGIKIACVAIAVFSVVKWFTLFDGLPNLANPRGSVRIVSDEEFDGFNLLAFLPLFSGMTALFFRSPLWRYPLIALAVTLTVALGSRNTLLAFAAGYFAYFMAYATAVPHRGKVALVVALALAALGAIVAVLATPDIWTWLTSSLLQLDVQGRGVGSGFTGRTEIWLRAVEVWRVSPLLGNGFRIFDGNRHNGYLQVLGELGLLGLIWFAALILWSAREAFVHSHHRVEYAAIFAYCVAFASFNLFDSRPLNASNAVTLGFYFLAAYSFEPRPRTA